MPEPVPTSDRVEMLTNLPTLLVDTIEIVAGLLVAVPSGLVAWHV